MLLEILFVLGLGFISAFLFSKLNFGLNLKKFKSYNLIAFETIKSNSIPDEIKQKRLIYNAFKLFLNSLEILVKTMVVLSPYFLVWMISYLAQKPELQSALISTQAIILSLVSFGAFYLAKTIYAKF